MSSLPMPRLEQLLERLLADEVAAYGVLQVLLPVQLYGTADVALVVRGGVLVDLDQDGVRVVELGLDPVGVDEYVGSAHECSSGCTGKDLGQTLWSS